MHSPRQRLTELLVAVPRDVSDVYVRHQQVWAAVRPYMSTGADFLFRRDSDRVYRVRSRKFRGAVRSVSFPATGRLSVDVSPVVNRFGRYTRVPAPEVASWFRDLAHRNGLEVADLRVESLADAVGRKVCHASGRVLTICIPAARVAASYSIADSALVNRAVEFGIGRARRFGFGMLDLVL